MSFRTNLLDYFRRRDRGWVFSLFAAVCIVYLPFLGSPFIFDDLNFFTGDVPGHYAHSLFQFDLRWLPYASLGWTYAIFSDVAPHFFRLGNVLLHAANVILLFYLLRQLITALIPEQEKSSAIILGAWLAALVFAVHPVAVYAVGYVIQRSILLATLFSLLMQLAYMRGLLTGQKRWLVLAVIAYFLAVFSKEHSAMSLAVLAAMTILLRAKNRIGWQALSLTWGAFIIIALWVVLRAKGIFGTPYETMAAALFEQQGVAERSPMLHLLSILTQAGLFFKYLLLWWLPNTAWMSVDMRAPFIPPWSAWQGWLGATGFIGYGALGGWLLFRPRWMGLAGLALLYPWLQFSVEFFSIRVQEPFVLYRSYLWMPGMMLLFPLLLTKFTRRGTLLGLGFVILLLVSLAWNRLWVFGDNYRLWNDAALLLHDDQEPGADRIFYNRGNAELADKNWEAAVADFQRAVALSPQLAPVRYALGLAYFNSGRYQDALAQFDAAIIIQPDDASFYYAKGMSLKRLHQDEQSRRQMEKSCELKNMMACMIVTTRQKTK